MASNPPPDKGSFKPNSGYDYIINMLRLGLDVAAVGDFMTEKFPGSTPDEIERYIRAAKLAHDTANELNRIFTEDTFDPSVLKNPQIAERPISRDFSVENPDLFGDSPLGRRWRVSVDVEMGGPGGKIINVGLSFSGAPSMDEMMDALEGIFHEWSNTPEFAQILENAAGRYRIINIKSIERKY